MLPFRNNPHDNQEGFASYLILFFKLSHVVILASFNTLSLPKKKKKEKEECVGP